MPEKEWLAQQFEAHRTHLQRVAFRVLGSQREADDAVQESWLRLNRSNSNDIENLRGWLTTVVARICFDMLRSRKSRREEPLDKVVSEPIKGDHDENDPEREALLAESVGLALLVVLDTLSPDERIAFVLHDMFDLPFVEIAPILGCSLVAARQLASRARRRVRGTTTIPNVRAKRQREVVEAFLAASRAGDFDGLLALLDPDATFRSDQAATTAWATRETHGARAIAEKFKHARGAQLALVNGSIGAVAAPGGQVRGVFRFTISGGKIVEIDMLGDPVTLSKLKIEILED